MAIRLEEIKSLIKEAIPDAEISIEDLAGDENHYSATIKSKIFSGKSKIDQHKIVYKALRGKMGNEVVPKLGLPTVYPGLASRQTAPCRQESPPTFPDEQHQIQLVKGLTKR